MNIRQATLTDWDAIRTIYQAGILTGDATYSTVADIPDSAEAWFASKVDGLTFVAEDVAEDAGEILGWVAFSPLSKRRVYRGIVEISVYVAVQAQGRGVGSALLRRGLSVAEQAGIWTIEARIFPTNIASLSLHEKLGFRQLGTHQHRAAQAGVWRDVVSLEWRSARDAEPTVALARPTDFAAVQALLQQADLPFSDLTVRHIDHFLVSGSADKLAGCIGFEPYGTSCLLRSLAVAPDQRGNGLGSELVARLEAFVALRGITQAWLLTTSAESFFARRGYRVVERSRVPEGVRMSAEFTELCPDSAVCMMKCFDAQEYLL